MLTDEQGPAHKKVFYVKLVLGEKEEYSAAGASIKKAQHVAAAQALETTQFQHPPPKQPKTSVSLSEWVFQSMACDKAVKCSKGTEIVLQIHSPHSWFTFS